jgi:hypothetical protein
MPWRISRLLAIIASGMAVVTVPSAPLGAASVPVPNASFESPTTAYASPLLDSWQKTPRPDWYEEGGGFLWSQLVGAFRNPAPGSPDRTDNCDGNQAIWLFAVREVGLFQDYDTVDWDDLAPTHAFDARFNPGNAYRFTVGLFGGGGGMREGATLELSLYYRDASSNRVAVAVTMITNSVAQFPINKHLFDFHVDVPWVKASDPWANQHIGMEMRSSIADTNLEGGYWDLDNVRLEAIQGPILVASAVTNDQFTLTWQSEPGLRFEIHAATNISQSISNWASLGMVTNTTGTATFTDTTTGFNRRFYQTRQLP